MISSTPVSGFFEATDQCVQSYILYEWLENIKYSHVVPGVRCSLSPMFVGSDNVLVVGGIFVHKHVGANQWILSEDIC
jgi:hypothetical protein